MPRSGFYYADDANLQTVLPVGHAGLGTGQHTITDPLPNTFYQLDFVCGSVITTLGPATQHFYHARTAISTPTMGA